MKKQKQRIKWQWRSPTFEIDGKKYYMIFPIGRWKIIDASTGKIVKRKGGNIKGG